MEESESLNATAAPKPAGRFLSRYQKRKLRRKSGLRPILPAAFLFALTLGLPMASWADGLCGGNGQRGCCIGENGHGLTNPCDSGLSYANGCNDPRGCACSNLPGFNSLGMCYPPLSAAATGNGPVATALANTPTIASPVTRTRTAPFWCKFPAHAVQETRPIAFAAAPSTDQGFLLCRNLRSTLALRR